ncbi:MAG: esterase [Clostridiales bacterium]|nr:esterase [Clostridiales bacterium]
METNYYRNYSPALGKDVEMKVYGHAGRPLIFIPCQDGRFYDFENFHMTDTWAPWIESGQVMVFSIDTIDQETWSNQYGDAHWRICRYEQWINYITDEVVPFAREMVNERNGWTGYPGVMVFGCSLGATHAANLYFRRPDLFDGLLALSGIYTAEYGFGDYMDDLVYMNSPIHYLANMPEDHPYIDLYNRKKGIICVGQGPWERPESTRQLHEIFERKHIGVWVDYWGLDCAHDLDWWYQQVEYYAPFLLGRPEESELTEEAEEA